MPATLNLHRVFSTQEGYLHALRVRDEDDAMLRTSREEIRAALRGAFAAWPTFVAKVQLFDHEALAKSTDAAPKLPQPKFRIQGSFAYFTANDCQHPPLQQIDQDDGVFLPVSFLMNGGGVRPSIASKGYFELVEKALGPLCEKRGWLLKSKNTCVRVVINARLHIDLPLYAIQDEAFTSLMQAEIARDLQKSLTMDAQIDLDEEVYRRLAGSEILLAHRTEGWIVSDPRVLQVWFENAVALYGQQIRRLSRVFKGLRDWRWAESDLGSIAIMGALVQARSALREDFDSNRDDLAIVTLAREMSGRVLQAIENPAFPGQPECNLCKDWSPEFRQQVSAMWWEAAEAVESAIRDQVHKGLALNKVRAVFGDRLPTDESLVSLVGVAAVIRSEVPQPAPRPMVPRSKSG